jgi:hypothetical protein
MLRSGLLHCYGEVMTAATIDGLQAQLELARQVQLSFVETTARRSLIR